MRLLQVKKSNHRAAVCLGLMPALALLLACAQNVGGADPQAPDRSSAVQSEFFENRVRPILAAHCSSCHGNAVQQGGLRLDTAEGLRKGGNRGAAIVQGKPAESLLVQAVGGKHPTLSMPPTGPLKPEQVANLIEWVRLGAYWPEYKPGTKPEHAPSLWALRSVRRPPVPMVRNRAWLRNPIDAYVLHSLEAKGMTPAPPAAKRDLMRRAYFDLVGLPPTPQEVAVYMADASPRAYEKLIDRLLASPHYGERWGRYWLDLARYADTNGYERDAPKPEAWKYRDYVIRSLNDDKPFDRFVLEQLAGDELPNRTEATVAATGFLRLGTWDDEPNDPLEYKYERLDDLVHATSSAFLGMTVRCARCHDHKFDPIPQKDYYALAAAFYGGYLDPGDRNLNGGPPPERLGYSVLGFTDRGREAPPLRLLKNGDPRREADVVTPGYLSMVTQVRHAVQSPPAGANTTRRRLQLAQWITDPTNPLTPRVLANRLWQHHFGHGLVRTPNNFGSKGALPTHPELLDWLAAELVRPSGQGAAQRPWSLKRIHRLIMLSNTYRMASQHPQQAANMRKDALNLLLWRANRRRLDADALRDSMLAVSGELNKRAGGPGFLPTVPREALEGLSRKGAEWNPSAPDDQKRRSVYMFLKRALLMPLLTVFDFGDTTAPLEQRDVTTVAPQALALMNNPFVHQQSEALARRVAATAGVDRDRQVEAAWQLAYGRGPTATERSAALSYLRVFPVQRPGNPAEKVERISRKGLRLWLRADQGVTTGADGVTHWADQSGNGHDATPAISSGSPRWVEKGLNGRPALRFDGKDDYLAIRGPVLTSQQFSLFAVVADRGGSGSHREIFSNWNGAAGNVGTSLFLGTTGANAVRFTDHFAPAGTLSRAEKPFVLSGIAGPEEVVVTQNRMELARLAAALPKRNLSPPYVIGQQGSINGEFWNGDVLELLVYDRALSEEERNAVCDELLERHRLALPLPPADPALASLCRALFNANEFLYID
jgi:mono/diheme cytochrome c family protein